MSKILALLFSAALLLGCSKEPFPHDVAPGQLSDENKARISQLHVRVGGDANYPPFVYRDDTGKLVGLSVDFFDELAKRIGLKYEITFVGQRADMLKRLENKDIDVTLASRTASSRPYLIVTQPYEYSKGTLLVNKGFNPGQIKIVGAGRGYASVTWLRTNQPQYLVVEYQDDEACIKALQVKEVNACIMGREIAFFFLEKMGISVENFDMTPTEYNYFLSFGVHADNLELVDILMKGFETIPSSVRREILKKWLKEPYL